MRQTARIISIYAADTSGVCSMLYELGGLTVVHDASGCNSTYSTHDEPRWYDQDSAIYISALTEMQAILGDDDKIIGDIVETATEISPRFIAICGSPMPMMIGTDFDALARAVEQRTGIPTFGMHTNGMHSYLVGASEALSRLVERFCDPKTPRTGKPSANIIGATPLDFSLNGSADSMRAWVADCGLQLVSCMAMGSTLDEISQAGGAHVNLVVSSDGLETARLLEERFGTPYVVGVPIGTRFSARLEDALHEAARTGESSFPCAERDGGNAQAGGIAVVGEPVFSGSLACAIQEGYRASAHVLTQLESAPELMAACDASVADEAALAERFGQADTVIADPLFEPVCPKGTRFLALPHEAFSGRCYSKSNPDLVLGGFERRFDNELNGR